MYFVQRAAVPILLEYSGVDYLPSRRWPSLAPYPSLILPRSNYQRTWCCLQPFVGSLKSPHPNKQHAHRARHGRSSATAKSTVGSSQRRARSRPPASTKSGRRSGSWASSSCAARTCSLSRWRARLRRRTRARRPREDRGWGGRLGVACPPCR